MVFLCIIFDIFCSVFAFAVTTDNCDLINEVAADFKNTLVFLLSSC